MSAPSLPVKSHTTTDPAAVDAAGTASWVNLQQTEKKRREILLFGDDPLWRIMTRYNGSVMPILLTDVQLYLTMAVYVVVRCLIYSKRDIFPPYLAELVQGQITVVGGFIRYVG
jgi:hypothetical protein